jgi:hypothetical protein
MKNGIIFDKILFQFIIFTLLISSIKGQNSKCLHIVSESEIYNFYYLKSNPKENK